MTIKEIVTLKGLARFSHAIANETLLIVDKSKSR